MRGAYGEVGIDIVCEGDPKPDIPETLCRLLIDVATVGRFGSGGGEFPNFCKFEEEFEFESAGGVLPPYVEFNVDDDCVTGTDPLPLLESVLLSVLKLDLDLLRMSLKKGGAILQNCA